MPRPRSFDEELALDAVEDLFWRQGYELTSYADLMEATGLGKGSLYAAFGDKQALYLRALQRYIDREVGQAGALLTDASLTGEARIATLMQMPIAAVTDRRDRRGCFLCNAAVDLAPFDPAAEDMVTTALNAIFDTIKETLQACKPTRATPEGLFAAYIGMRVMAKAGLPVEALVAARETALLPLHD
ncbi:MAG: TetR/AcrR family transcriptional regulator [Pseudomonadota bacterium]